MPNTIDRLIDGAIASHVMSHTAHLLHPSQAVMSCFKEPQTAVTAIQTILDGTCPACALLLTFPRHSKEVASQLADETLFLSYPKEELESKFLVDASPCERAAFCLRKRTTNLFVLQQQMSVLCCLVYSALHVSSCL